MKRSPLLVIFITVFIDLVGFGIVIPILPFYVQDSRFAASPSMVGLLFASYSLMQFLFTPVLGRLSDKYGRRPVLFLSIIGTGVGFLIMGAATTLWMLFAGRILDGITGGNISTAQAYIADVTKPEERAKGMGMIGAAFGMGFIFGPALGGILSRWGINVPLYFAAALAFLNATLLYFTLPESLDKNHPARSAVRFGLTEMWGALARTRLGLIVAVYFMLIVAFSMMTSSFALFTMYRFGFDAQHNGYIFTFIGILAVGVQLLIVRRFVHSYGEMPFIVCGLGLLLTGLVAIPLVGPAHGGLVALLLAGGFVSIGNQLAAPLLTSLASKSVGADVQGGTLGMLQSLGSLARFVGPVIQSFLIYSATAAHHLDDHSLRVTFWTAAAITFVACLLALYLRIRTHAAAYVEANLPATSGSG
ncbi:MAG: MFS transporter [Pyrinomonadaceae bacterium]|nr:MFS transporter [Pyrinomonadaceae bacterium]